MAYDVNTKIISAPVSFNNVQTALSTSENRIKYLCTHANINKWSKKKPVIFDSIFTTNTPLWWKGDNGRCGLTIPEYNSLTAIIAAYDAGTINWTYNKPAGGEHSPYRLVDDFNNYFHGATPPFINWFCSEWGVNLYVDSTIGANIQARFIDSDALSISDIGDYSSWYFGAVMINGTITRYGSSTDTLGNLGFSAFINTSGIPIGTYSVYPFISPLPIDQNPTTFTALEGFIKKSVKIYNSQYSVSVNADWNEELTQCNYTIYIQNRGSSYTIENCYVMLRDNNNDWNDIMMNGEISNNISNISIPSSSSITVEGSITVPNYNAFPTWRFWFVGDGGDVLVSTIMFQPV